MNESVSQFLLLFRDKVEAGLLVKCTLSKPSKQVEGSLKNLFFRIVELKRGKRVAVTYRYANRDEVKQYFVEEAYALLELQLGGCFFQADLFAVDVEVSLSFGVGGNARIRTGAPVVSRHLSMDHDRKKERMLDSGASWLHHLGITNARGVVLSSAQDKWRQINRYLELLESSIREAQLPSDVHVADMGSGKGYLTFALYDYLVTRLGYAPRVVGIELRPDLVDGCNRLARDVGFIGLEFKCMDIGDFRPSRMDVLIALHACDTATDLAIYRGIRMGSRLIVVAPCCHKQVRLSMVSEGVMRTVMRHGILEERQAEILTDGIRALLMESCGYRSHVFEFITAEHTAKNLMITGLLVDSGRESRELALGSVGSLKRLYGIERHYLEELLRENAE